MGFVTYVRDTFQNFVTGLGKQGVDPGKSVQYILELLARDTLENMYRGDWLARKICDQPAEDITREWRAWQANQEQIEAIELVEKTLDLQRKVKQWIIKARLYGGSALIIGVDDGNPPNQPIDLEKCKKGCLKYVVVLHRYELNAGPRIYNVNDPYYTRAAYYTVATPMFGFSGEGGTVMPNIPGQPPLPPPGAVSAVPPKQKNVVPFGKSGYPITAPINIGLEQIHPSRVLELPGNELPDWRLAPLGGGWGDSVLQTVVDTMNSFITIYQSIGAMVADGKLDVIKVPDMANNLMDQKYKDRLIDRFALSAQTKSVISALLLDKEEEWDRITTAYSGLDMILHEFLTLLSGAADIPVSILFGQAYGKGLQGGSTGGGADDVRSYYDKCATKQKNDIAPRLGMLDQVLMRSALGKADPNVNYTWNPLWQLSDDDKSKISLAKAQTTQIYTSLGLINEDAMRDGVVNQLIEDAVYPGFDDAIEEYGSEPEEPDDTGGFEPPSMNDPGDVGFGQGEPNPDDTGFSGQMGDSWTEEAREASAEARRLRASRIAELKKRAQHHEEKAEQHKEGSRKRALHSMAAGSYHEAINEYLRKGGDPEVAELHAAVAKHMQDALTMDEEVGHVFHGNQHTGGLGGRNQKTQSSRAKRIGDFLSSPGARAAMHFTAKETIGLGVHVSEHALDATIASTITGSLMALGSAFLPAAVAAASADYAVHRIAHHLGIDAKRAHELCRLAVGKLTQFADDVMSRQTGMQALGYGDADEDPILRGLHALNNALNSYSTEQLMRMAEDRARHFKYDEEAGHPFRGNQYTTGESGGGKSRGEQLREKYKSEEAKPRYAGEPGDHPGEGYSKSAKIDEHGVIQTDNVDDAARALFENKRVELNQIKQVSTLIDKLGQVAADMEKKGEKAPKFNLCNVSVKGTNLFCTESQGIPRVRMPQFRDNPHALAFVDYLKRQGIKSETGTEYAANLRATQDELGGKTVAGIMGVLRSGNDPTDLAGRPLVISKDDYIVDGHHTWAAKLGLDAADGILRDDKQMNVVRVDLGIIHILHLANKFTGKGGRKQMDRRRVRDYEGQPRAASAPGHSSGEFASKGGGIEALTEEGAGTFGKSEPAGGEKASPGVPASLIKAIEDHVEGMGGEFLQHGSADLTKWLMLTHRQEMLDLIDNMPPNKRPTLLLHKGDEAKGMPSVWLLGWSDTEKTDIHDHVRSEVGISVLRGNIDNEWNHPPPDYLDAAKSESGLQVPINKDVASENQTLSLQAPYIHLMRGTSPSKASGRRDVAVHAYHPPLRQMHYFKSRGGALHYDGDWDEDRPPSEYSKRDRKMLMDGRRGCLCCMPWAAR